MIEAELERSDLVRGASRLVFDADSLLWHRSPGFAQRSRGLRPIEGLVWLKLVGDCTGKFWVGLETQLLRHVMQHRLVRASANADQSRIDERASRHAFFHVAIATVKLDAFVRDLATDTPTE